MRTSRGARSRGRVWWVVLPVMLSSCGWATDRSLLLRGLMWRDADMGDIDRFPMRVIERGDGPVFEFETLGPAGLSGSAYQAVFDPLVLRTDVGPDTVPFRAFVEGRQSWSFLVMRRDTLLAEWYFAGKAGDRVETTFSASKSVLSMAVGLAVDRGLIAGVQDPVTDYLPELLDRDPRFKEITLHHLLTMSSGIRFSRGKMPWGDEARSYYDPDLRAVALAREVEEPPGERFEYNFYNPLLVGLALERAAGMSVSDLIQEGLWSRIGAERSASWSLDSKRHGFEKMESGFNAAPRDLLRLGRLMLHGGQWQGDQLLSEEWVRLSTAADSVSDPNVEYAYMWWVHPVEGRSHSYFAAGRFGQYVWVVPDLELVMVRTGSGEGDVGWRSVFELVANRVAEVDSLAAIGNPRP